MNELGRYDNLLSKVLKPFQTDKLNLGGEIFRLLFILAFDDLKRAEAGNPLDHILVVLKHTIEIAKKENFSHSEMIHACSIAILHDIASVKKIRKADVENIEDEDGKRILEQKRKQSRTLHMREGSALAQRKLLLLNDYLGKIFYTDDDIDAICEVIRIHDNPSLGIPLPNDNRLAIVFREADRLWMLSDEGFAYDLQQDTRGIKALMDVSLLASKRLKHVMRRFQEERKLYSADDGRFQDNSLFFRTSAGYSIYHRYIRERMGQYKLK